MLIVGGDNNSGYLASAELFDPTTGTWAATGGLTTGRYIHTATLLPTGKVLVAGGFDGAQLASAELYDSVTGAWTFAGSMTTKRAGHTATILPSGEVLVVGQGVLGNHAGQAPALLAAIIVSS